VKGLTDQGVGSHRAVATGVEGRGVDVVDAEFHGAAQDGTTGCGIAGRAVETVRGQAHGPEADPVDQQVTTEWEVIAHQHSGGAFGLRARGSFLPSGTMARWQRW
jgi:hypothetical protein